MVVHVFENLRSYRIELFLINFVSLQRVVPRLSSAVKMEAVWISQHVVMITGTAVTEAMRRIVV